jgi:hypothetical protein
MVLNKIISDREALPPLEGNSPAHIKASLMGPSSRCLVSQGRDCSWAPGRESFWRNSTGPAPARCTSKLWQVKWREMSPGILSRSGTGRPTSGRLPEEGAVIRDRYLLKDFLEYTHIRQGLLAPMTPPIPWWSPGNCCRPLKRTSRNTSTCPASAWWPSTAPFSYQEEIFQFDLLHPPGEGNRRSIRENLDKIAPHLDRDLRPDFQAAAIWGSGISPTWRTIRECWNFSSTWTGPT